MRLVLDRDDLGPGRGRDKGGIGLSAGGTEEGIGLSAGGTEEGVGLSAGQTKEGIELSAGGTGEGIELSTGQITGLLGRNGCGKSRLMQTAFSRHRGLRYLPQSRWVPAALTLKRVFEDFEVEYGWFEGCFPEFLGRHNYTLKQLSGGQGRLVETCLIIRAAADFVLLDEPFTHLMPLQIEKVIELLLEEKHHKGFLITDHLYQHVLAVANSVFVLAQGKVREVKDPAEIKSLGYAGTGSR